MEHLQEQSFKFQPIRIHTCAEDRQLYCEDSVDDNEEVLEDIIFQVEDGKFIDDSLVNHICSSLNRKYKLCLGIENTQEFTNFETIEKILIEKYGDNIFYRSRNCSR